MRILKFSLGQLQANCYFLTEGDNCLIIDPADEGSFILEELQRRRLKLKAMLATHGHFDHIMAVGEIQKSFSIPLYISEKDLFLMKRLMETAKYYLGYNPQILTPITVKYLTVRNFQISIFLPCRQAGNFQIIKTPGHTPGGVCYYFPEEKIIFTGDTLFKGAVGRYDFSYASKKDLQKSLRGLFNLPPDTIIYPGHGESSTIGQEKMIHTDC